MAAEYPAEQPLITAAFGRRDHVADHRQGDHQQPAAAQPLQRAHQNQLRHVLRQPTQYRPKQKQHNSDLQHNLAAEEIAEFAVQRHYDSGRQQIGRHHPRQFLKPTKLADDGRQRGGDNGLIQRRQQHHQQQRGKQQRERRRLGWRPP